MLCRDAAKLLGVTPAAVRARCTRAHPAIRGVPPRSAENPGSEWLVLADDVERLVRAREVSSGSIARPAVSPAVAPAGTEGEGGALTLGDPEVEIAFLRRDLQSERDQRVEQYEQLLREKDARIAEMADRVAELTGRVTQLENLVAATSQAYAQAFTRPA